MNTPWNSNGEGRALWRRVLALSLVAMVAQAGCAYSGGELLYFMGVGSGEKVEAQFLLTEHPVMVFVDDVHERLSWPPAERYIFDAITQELLRNEAAHKIIPRETILRLRQSEPDFQRRGCREIGELAGAEQVLWIEVRDCLADPEIRSAIDAAYLIVTVKVINVLETEHRTRVRLWPNSPEGHHISVSMGGAEAVESKTKDAITKKLADRLAVDVARLFYDHELDGFGRNP